MYVVIFAQVVKGQPFTTINVGNVFDCGDDFDLAVQRAIELVLAQSETSGLSRSVLQTTIEENQCFEGVGWTVTISMTEDG